MKVERLLARRFLYLLPTQQEASQAEAKGGKQKKLRPVIKISTAGIACGTALILLSIFVIQGFKKEIDQMINGVIGTLRISNFQNNFDQYTIPLTASGELISTLSEIAKAEEPAAQVAAFIDEMALIKSDSAFTGALLHGVPYPHGLHFFESYITSGALPTAPSTSAIGSSTEPSYDILLPLPIAQQLGYHVGDQLYTYFLIEEAVKVRKYIISGIYQTGFDQYDQHFIIADLRSLQSLKGWIPDQYSGITITLPTSQQGDELYPLIRDYLTRISQEGQNALDGTTQPRERYALFTARELNFNIFGWLGLLDANVLLIFVLMLAVAAMTIITGVIVLILEKVRTIATLKALGQRQHSLQRVFAYVALHIIARGLLAGTLLALLLGFVQKQWQPLTLDASQYYMTHVPIEMTPLPILLTLLCIFLGVFLFVLIPITLIQKLNTSQALRFE